MESSGAYYSLPEDVESLDYLFLRCTIGDWTDVTLHNKFIMAPLDEWSNSQVTSSSNHLRRSERIISYIVRRPLSLHRMTKAVGF